MQSIPVSIWITLNEPVAVKRRRTPARQAPRTVVWLEWFEVLLRRSHPRPA